jgi:hypothetical protein
MVYLNKIICFISSNNSVWIYKFKNNGKMASSKAHSSFLNDVILTRFIQWRCCMARDSSGDPSNMPDEISGMKTHGNASLLCKK